MSGLSCAFTGHRPQKLPWRYNEDDPRCLDLKERMYIVTESAIAAGVARFYCGMAEGCDLYFCETVLALREKYPEIRLEAAVPFAGQTERWSPEMGERYDRLLSQCDTVTVLQQEYSTECMMRRNRYMVDRSDALIACYDGKPGGTLNTLRYAVRRGLRILYLEIE